jgi:hypothetical protein
MLKEIKDNGDCVIAGFNFKGEVNDESVDVECKLMLTDFLCVKGQEIKNASYPEKGPLASTDWATTEFASKITVALTMAARYHGLDKEVLCRLEPRSALFALQKYKKGELILVPCTTRIKTIDAKKETQMPSIIEEMLSCRGSAMPTGYSFHLAPESKEKFVCPAWFAQGTADFKLVNLKVMMFEVEINGKIGQSKLATNETSTITIPMLVNSKSVEEGTELKYHKPKDDNDAARASTKRPFDAIM